MRFRQNKKFIDPRYFMDEKMEVIDEATSLLDDPDNLGGWPRPGTSADIDKGAPCILTTREGTKKLYKGDEGYEKCVATPHKGGVRKVDEKRKDVDPYERALEAPLAEEEEEKWIQGAEKDIEKRGTEGVCTGDKFGGPTCRPGTKRYNLAKTFRKMAKDRKK